MFRSARKAAVLAALLLPAALTAANNNVVRSFDGDTGPGLAACESGVTHCDRPEMAVAANGKQVVQTTWQNVLIFDYSGHLVKSTPMAALIRSAGLNPVPPKQQGPFEPHIVYDEFIDRWIITVTGLNDCLLVSATSDAAGAWGGFYLSCLQDGPCLNFDAAVHLGYDKNGVYDCGGHLGDDNPHTVPKVAYDCFALPPAEVKAIAQSTPPAHINRMHNLPLDIIPAIDHNRSKAAGAPEFFAAKTCDRNTQGACQNSLNYPFSWIVDTFTWNGATGTYNASGEQIIKTGVGSKDDKWLYSKPCCTELASLPQAGNDTIKLRVAESHRLMNLIESGSHLYGVLTSGPSQGSDPGNVMFWVDMDCSKPDACVVSQTGKISGPTFNPEFATIGVDAAGNMGIVASSSTATTDMSVLLWTHRKDDPSGTFTGPITVVAGTQPYTCLNARNMVSMGNAVGVLTTRDPKDGSKLWTSQQWSNNADRCVWNTRIIQYQIATK